MPLDPTTPPAPASDGSPAPQQPADGTGSDTPIQPPPADTAPGEIKIDHSSTASATAQPAAPAQPIKIPPIYDPEGDFNYGFGSQPPTTPTETAAEPDTAPSYQTAEAHPPADTTVTTPVQSPGIANPPASSVITPSQPVNPPVEPPAAVTPQDEPPAPAPGQA